MRKMFLLALTLTMLSAASANAQVRIGGETEPNKSAVLDLNATDAINNGKLGLALPRVTLLGTDDKTTIANPATGLTVYNMTPAGGGTTAVVKGLYIYDGSNWQPVLASEVDGTVGNEITDATSSGGLTRAGSGTAANPYTLGIADGGVTSAKIADGTIETADLNAMGATTGQVLMYDGSTWNPVTLSGSAYCSGAIVYDGAYNGPAEGEYVSDICNSSALEWTNAAFAMKGRDLCWAKTDEGHFTYGGGKAACAALTTDGHAWRLPNLMELVALYNALGGTGGVAIDFAVLNSNGKGASRDTTPMQPWFYQSSTLSSPAIVYGVAFNNSIIGCPGTDIPTLHWTRCVRSL